MPNPLAMHMPFHDGGFMQMPRGHQANLHYGHPAMSPFINSPVGYTPWPNSPAMNYAQSLHGPDTHLFRLLIVDSVVVVLAILIMSRFCGLRFFNPAGILLQAIPDDN